MPAPDPAVEIVSNAEGVVDGRSFLDRRWRVRDPVSASVATYSHPSPGPEDEEPVLAVHGPECNEHDRRARPVAAGVVSSPTIEQHADSDLGHGREEPLQLGLRNPMLANHFVVRPRPRA